MVDQQTRQQLANTLRAYLNEDIMAFQFDETLNELAEQTDDETVQEVTRLLWFHYDDLKDHKVHATKEVWDYFQRLLLLLESEGEFVTTSTRQWSFRQLIALTALAGFLYFAWHVGWGDHLLIVSIPFGVVSILLSCWRSLLSHRPTSKERDVYPFASASELLRVRRRVPSFTKQPYPPALQSRTIRTFGDAILMRIQSTIGWLIFAPIPLLFQAMPDTDTKRNVRIP